MDGQPPATPKKLRNGITEKITDIIDDYDTDQFDKNTKTKIEGIFTGANCTSTSRTTEDGHDFADIFDATSVVKDGKDAKIHLYSNKSTLLLYYFVSFKTEIVNDNTKATYMVIASRLDNLDKHASDKSIETEKTAGGGPKEDRLLQRVTEYMEKLKNKSIEKTQVSEEVLEAPFTKAAETNLATGWGGKLLSKPKIMYTKYKIDHPELAELNRDYAAIFANEGSKEAPADEEEGGEEEGDEGSKEDPLITNTYCFKVLFKGFLYKEKFYFEKTKIKAEVVPLVNYNGPVASESSNGGAVGDVIDPGGSGGSGTAISTPGGGNIKLKRKQLNTMSLNELKQLHRNAGISMNSNKTVNALINNYIKHH